VSFYVKSRDPKVTIEGISNCKRSHFNTFNFLRTYCVCSYIRKLVLTLFTPLFPLGTVLFS
jgi:hypothetical protein